MRAELQVLLLFYGAQAVSVPPRHVDGHMCSCLAQMKGGTSRQRLKSTTSRLVKGVKALIARAQGCSFETPACPTP